MYECRTDTQKHYVSSVTGIAVLYRHDSKTPFVRKYSTVSYASSLVIYSAHNIIICQTIFQFHIYSSSLDFTLAVLPLRVYYPANNTFVRQPSATTHAHYTCSCVRHTPTISTRATTFAPPCRPVESGKVLLLETLSM